MDQSIVEGETGLYDDNDEGRPSVSLCQPGGSRDRTGKGAYYVKL